MIGLTNINKQQTAHWQILTCIVDVNLVPEQGVPLHLATVLRRILTIDALMHIDFLKVKLLAMIQNSAWIIGKKAAAFARILPLVVIIRVDDRTAWVGRSKHGLLLGRLIAASRVTNARICSYSRHLRDRLWQRRFWLRQAIG